MSVKSDIVGKLGLHYFWAWQEGNWAKLREILSPDVEFEDPRLGKIIGVEAHLALYTEERRFPNLNGVAERGAANSEDLAFVSYDAYLGTRRTVTAIDQLLVRNDQIVRVLSVTSEWPSREQNPDDVVLAARAHESNAGT